MRNCPVLEFFPSKEEKEKAENLEREDNAFIVIALEEKDEGEVFIERILPFAQCDCDCVC